jgi:hypothetical protein
MALIPLICFRNIAQIAAGFQCLYRMDLMLRRTAAKFALASR